MSKFKIITKGVEVVVKHKSLILKVLGIAGIGLAVADAAIQGPKAQEALEQAQEEKGEEPLTTLEKVKVAGPILARPIALGAAGVASLCTGYNIQVKELTKNCANLATAYNGLQAGAKVIQENSNAYQEAAKEVVGEEKEKEIKEKAAKKIEEKYSGQGTAFFPAKKHEDDILWMEPTTKHMWYDGPDLPSRVEKILNDKKNLNDLGVVPLNAIFRECNQLESPAARMWGWPPRNRFSNSYISVWTGAEDVGNNLPAVKVLIYSEDPELLGPEYANYMF